MLDQIYGDVWGSLSNYGPGALAVGVVTFSGLLSLVQKKGFKCLYLGMLAAYLYLLLNLTFLSRSIGQVSMVNLTLFNISRVFPAYTYIQYAENFLLFLPLGILLPMGIKLFRLAFFGLLSGFAISAGIEYMQYRLSMGVFDLDDIMMNGLGFAAGYMVFTLFSLPFIGYSSKEGQ